MLKVKVAENKQTLDLCLYVRDAVFTIEKNISREIEVDEHDVLNGSCDHFLLEYDGKPVGALRCIHVNEAAVKLQRFCILKEYRKLGLGREMLEAVEMHYRSDSFSEIELDAKYEAYVFYEKCGYRKVSDVFEEAGIPHVKMVKAL